MNTKVTLALVAGASALMLALPALAGGYWDGDYGGRGGYGDDGYCPPPPPPPCDCPPQRDYGYGRGEGWGYRQAPQYNEGYDAGYGEGYGDEGFAPSAFYDEGYDGGVGGPGYYDDDYYGGGFVRGRPVVGVGLDFGDRDRFDRFGRERFGERERFGFSAHQRFSTQQHVAVRQHATVQTHVGQHFYGHASMGGHGRW